MNKLIIDTDSKILMDLCTMAERKTVCGFVPPCDLIDAGRVKGPAG